MQKRPTQDAETRGADAIVLRTWLRSWTEVKSSEATLYRAPIIGKRWGATTQRREQRQRRPTKGMRTATA